MKIVGQTAYLVTYQIGKLIGDIYLELPARIRTLQHVAAMKHAIYQHLAELNPGKLPEIKRGQSVPVVILNLLSLPGGEGMVLVEAREMPKALPS